MRNTQKIVLTDAQRKWMVAHFKHTKNDDIAARFGWSHSTLHRFARELGLKKTPQFQTKMQRNAAAKANASHVKNGTYPPKGYKIPRSEEFRFQPGVTPEERLGKVKNRKRIEKAVATRKATFKDEKARARFGAPRRTKLRVFAQPRWVACQRHRLRTLGYIVDRGSMTAFYTPDTNRSEYYETRTRETARRYVGFTFKPIEERQ